MQTTLGVRRSDTGMDIVRGDNRNKSGINGDFLCIKGRYAFDYFGITKTVCGSRWVRKRRKAHAYHLGRSH